MGPVLGLWEPGLNHVGDQPSLRFQFTVSALDVFSPHGNLLSSQMELSYRLWALRFHPSITRLNYSFLSN